MTRMLTATVRGVRAARTLAAAALGVLVVASGCATQPAGPGEGAGSDVIDLTNAPATPPTDYGTPGPAGQAPAAPLPPITPPAPAEAPAPRTHALAKGETYYALAVKYYGSGNARNVQRIRDANPSLVETKLSVGTKVNVPE